MVKKSLIWLYSAATYLLWLVIIVIAVVVLGLRYFVLPHVKDYRQTIAQKASVAVGQRITIGDIGAGWSGLHPHFDLRQISIYDQAGRPALQFDHIETELSWVSLVVAEPRLHSLVIHEPRLTVRREMDGTIYVAGISMSGPSKPAFANWLLRQQKISVRDASIIWQDDYRHAPPLSFEKLNLVIERPLAKSLLNYHRFGVTAVPSVGNSNPIDVRGRVYGGDVSQFSSWHGTLYAAIEGTEISSWGTWLTLPSTFRQGAGAMRAWVEFSDDAIDKVTADVAMSNVISQIHADKSPLTMRQINGRIDWARTDTGYEVEASRLSLDADKGLNIRNGNLQFSESKTGAVLTTEGAAKVDTLALEPLVALADYLSLGDDIKQKLTALSPAGRLNKVNLSWQNKQDRLEKYAVTANFSDLGVKAVDSTPGFSGLSGTVDANQSEGRMTLESRSTKLEFPKVFREAIPADSMSAKLSWKRLNDVVELKVSNFSIASPHLNGVINASYRLDGKKGGYIDLTSQIRDVDLKYARVYYPMLLGKDTLHWLDTSIFGGRSDDVKVRLKGYLDDFPYIGGRNGEFSVTATIRDGIVDYANDWPKIEGLKLKMKFYENKMLLSEAQGRILGQQIISTTARINVLDADHPLLDLEGQMNGSVEDGLRFVAQSPILDATHHFTEGMRGGGNAHTALKLSIPLDNVTATRVNGTYTVNNGSLDGDGEWPTLDRINGVLNFTESSIKAKAVQAQIWGGPVAFNLASGGNGKVELLARGKLTGTGLHQAVNHPAMRYVSGITEWQGRIAIQNKHSEFLIDFPDLAGLSSTLPAPFSKSAEVKIPLHIEHKLSSDGGSDTIAVKYGDKLFSMKLVRSMQNGSPHIDRGDIRFGGDPHPASLARGIAIGGTLSGLDVDQWQDILESKSASSSNATFPVNSARLKVGMLDIMGRRLNDVQLDAKSDGGNWKTNIKSREINGDVTWLSQGSGHVMAKLDSLIFPEATPSKSNTPVENAAPHDYPSISLVANQFESKGKKLGKLELHAVNAGNNWTLDSLRIENPDFVADMSGVWSNWRRNSSTRLRLDMDVTDLGKTLDRFGYPGTVKGSTATLKGNLSWPDGPQLFSPSGLSGDFSLNVGKGQFLKLQPGVGRLLSVLSLQNLPRRLLLDFRDIFGSGFAFDKIAGDVRINQGVMRSDNFVMEGAAAKVNISGETDLARETQYLHVKVTPAISDSVSLAALAGGPAVAVGAFIAQKIFKDPFNQLVSYEYDIVGTWDEPRELKEGQDKKPVPAVVPLGN